MLICEIRVSIFLKKNFGARNFENMKLKLTAIIFLVLLSRLYADEASNFLNEGMKKGQGHDFDGAIADFSAAIQIKPDYVEAYNERGLAEGALAKKADTSDIFLSKALADYNKAIEINPAFAPAYYNRGNIMQALGTWDNAKADFKKVVELDANVSPQSPDIKLLAQAFLHLATLSQRAGDNSAAKLFYSSAYYYRGISESVEQKTNDALSDFSKAIELNPPFGQAYYNRGKIKFTMNDADGAMEDFNKAIELTPDLPDSYDMRGILKSSKGDEDGAMADFNKCIEVNPNYAIAYINRGIAKAKKADKDGSVADFRKAIELNPQMRKVIISKGYSLN